MLFSRKRHPPKLPPILLGDVIVDFVVSHKHLGLVLTPTLDWSKHMDLVALKCSRLLGILRNFKFRWSRKALETCYSSFIRPVIEYGNIIYDSCLKSDSAKLETLQIEAANIVTGAKRGTSHIKMLKELGWQSLATRRLIAKTTRMFVIKTKQSPKYLSDIFEESTLLGLHNTRGHARGDFAIPKCRTALYQRSFVYSGISIWNNLAPEIRASPTKASFKSNLKKLHSCQVPLFYHHTSRSNQIAFTQLRMEFSNLNSHLYYKGCIESCKCVCGNANENTLHYLLECTNYVQIRNTLLQNIRRVHSDLIPNMNLMLWGKNSLNDSENLQILRYVTQFIHQSGRLSGTHL